MDVRHPFPLAFDLPGVRAMAVCTGVPCLPCAVRDALGTLPAVRQPFAADQCVRCLPDAWRTRA